MKKCLHLKVGTILVFVSTFVRGQEFFAGTKSPDAYISRTGHTTLGYTIFRNATIGNQVIEHTNPFGNLYIRSVANTVENDEGNLILNDAGGFVGIGTTTPQQYLHVKGGVRVERLLNGNNYLELTGDTDGNYISAGASGTNQKSMFIRVSPTGDDNEDRHLHFQTGKIGGVFQTRLFIAGNGRVGIGTVTPKELFSVNGNIRAKEIKVETANWPDYVFRTDYVLMPLTEVKNYINANGHLPEMPNAKHVEEEGISLGEMNKLLLKKIEELTLYVIDKDNEIKEIQTELKRMKEREAN